MPQHADTTRPEDRDADPRDGRHETPTERMDRNWNELLQELRVAQTGVQILTGFLLTVPFQQRFLDLDDYQKTVYLVLVVLAVTATGFIVAPVSLHRILFRRHLKRELVDSADRMAQTGLAALALVLAGSALLLFDVVVGRTAGLVAGGATIVGLAVVWLVLPLRLSRRARQEAD
ncbi:DUF6328 family protein [Cellulomonas sp. ACRRI]|uniref:DUF6328 family protein n=1 Tax=Cellulomonas sp. ACRRI TaxID=2918188 RepID=UPI001EF2CE81|nr:DUF6328 family protein [Cellulomonas sp. ACRRI]MCG7285654.1 DUF6328 family protein [Cellulomonas sp. ACRRI]